jgi:hypothetical protein
MEKGGKKGYITERNENERMTTAQDGGKVKR